ncbi:MAG: 4Fe-4S binding protein [Bacteroidota bacterium]|nr:4Fe-4S binding protein [Bacteroidota bacterium]
MRSIKNTGMILVIFSVALLSMSLFINDYRLTRQAINKSSMEEGQKVAFDLVSAALIDNTYSSRFNFLDALEGSFTEANRMITSTYSIRESTIDRLTLASLRGDSISYSTELAGSLFRVHNKLSIEKINAIRDYTGWIAEKHYEDVLALKSDLTTAIEGYNKSLEEKKGFGKSMISNLKFELLKSSCIGLVKNYPWIFFVLTFVLVFAGSLMVFLPELQGSLPGIRNNHIMKDPLNSRGWIGILLGVYLILFYVILYWYPYHIAEWTLILDPLSRWISGRPSSQWFLYGFIYTLAILLMGIKFLIKYRHSRYHIIRTLSLMFFQLIIAFSLPQLLYVLNLPEVDLKNIWPLDYHFFFEWSINSYLEAGTLGVFMFGWGIALILLGVPLLTYFVGKRWYCSWVCGCGGLAETAGDPFRHLSDKRLIAWQIERWLVHGVLLFAVAMTAWVLYTFFSGKSVFLGISSYKMREVYGFAIGAMFAGVIGVGFYPFMGNRVWCRFGCPLAAYLGIVQRFKSRFRITTNGGQCMSCGNCSTYCEQGIDVRAYAQKGLNIIRASCVGCGICAAVCPRGVLRLENKKERGRFNEAVLRGNDNFLKFKKEDLHGS